MPVNPSRRSPTTAAASPSSPLSQTVRHLRLQRGWTQHRLAEESGLSRATVAAVEHHRYKGVDSRSLMRLAAAFGVSPGDLLQESMAAATVPTPIPHVDALCQSLWKQAINATPEEMAWLSELPLQVFRGLHTSPQVAAELLAWRRRHHL